jgi:uncharacterized protein YdeI (YjbR/CyaY-like superfamily)
VAEQREEVRVRTREQWRAWLAEHADEGRGCWLAYPRRGAVSYEELVLEALCVGWVDGQARAVDATWTALLMTPRKRGSGWARTNKERVERLEADGLMLPAGRAVVEAAQADGSWSLLDSAEALEEPSDLVAALDADPAARAVWDGFPPSARKAMLTWLVMAKRPQTRADRIATVVERAARGERAQG